MNQIFHRTASVSIAIAVLLAVQVGMATGQSHNTCSEASGKKAIRACTRVIKSGTKRKGRLKHAYNNRGFEFEKLDEHEKAIRDYGKAIEIDPDYSLAYANRGELYFGLAELHLALKDYNTALRLEPENDHLLRYRAKTFMRLGRYDEALNDLNQVILANPNQAISYILRSDLYRAVGRRRDALDDYLKANSIDSGWSVPDELERLREQQ